jgi:hypothetical protein
MFKKRNMNRRYEEIQGTYPCQQLDFPTLVSCGISKNCFAKGELGGDIPGFIPGTAVPTGTMGNLPLEMPCWIDER